MESRLISDLLNGGKKENIFMTKINIKKLFHTDNIIYLLVWYLFGDLAI